MVLVEQDMGTTQEAVTTKLLRVDLDRGVATYVVEVPSYITRWIVTSLISRLALTRLRTVVTEVLKSYYLPDGRLYTVLREPTRFELGEPSIITRLLGIDTQIVTLNHPPRNVEGTGTSGWSAAITRKLAANMI